MPQRAKESLPHERRECCGYGGAGKFRMNICLITTYTFGDINEKIHAIGHFFTGSVFAADDVFSKV